MVNIITGPVCSGKTAKMISYFKQNGGDGFALKKIFINSEFAGQSIVSLKSGRSHTFSLLSKYIPKHWDEIYHYMNYSFSKNGLNFANRITINILKNQINPVFIDEIGPLELNKLGFYRIFKLLLSKNKDIYITVRENCVNDVINKFKITSYNIIK